jgi:hypothetical protein
MERSFWSGCRSFGICCELPFGEVQHLHHKTIMEGKRFSHGESQRAVAEYQIPEILRLGYFLSLPLRRPLILCQNIIGRIQQVQRGKRSWAGGSKRIQWTQ